MPGLNPLRHQLASTSPVRWRGLVGAALEMARGPDAPNTALQRLRGLVCARHEVADAILTGSGTEALVLALELAHRVSGGTRSAALPAFSCFDVASAAVRVGRPVVFYDIHPKTLGPDPESLRRVLRDGAGIVVLASLYGVPLDWGMLDPVLAQSDAVVIEDAAQGHGASWAGKPLGGRGRLGVLSFGRGKGWTGGDGGVLLIRDPRDVECAAPLRDGLGRPEPGGVLLGRVAAHWVLGRPAVYGLPRRIPGLGLGETRYREAPLPRRMGSCAASLAIDGDGPATAWVGERLRVAREYAERLAESGARYELPQVRAPARAGYVRYPVLLPDGLGSLADDSEAIRLGAAPSYPRALPQLSQTAHLSPTPTGEPAVRHFPGARELVRRLITFPTHPLTLPEERERLVTLVRR